MNPKESLIPLFQKMADLTVGECKNCKIPYSCCSPEYCQMSKEHAQSNWGVTLKTTNHPTLPLMGWDGEKATGCTAPPHLRPNCTLHTCEINALGCKRGDLPWTEKYFDLREEIDEAAFAAFHQKL